MDWELGTAPGRSIRLRAAVVAGIFAVGCFGVLLLYVGVQEWRRK